ncbi:MAG: hypothetical protein WCD89_20125 [Anaerocolumna sp.]
MNRQKIILKSYLLASILVIIISYLVRLLPISFGVHSILNILLLFLICIIVLKMPAYKTILSTLLVTVLLVICEMVNVAVMIGVLGKEKFESMMLDTLEKAMIGFPGAIFFALLVTLAYVILNNQKKKKGENSGNISA